MKAEKADTLSHRAEGEVERLQSLIRDVTAGRMREAVFRLPT